MSFDNVRYLDDITFEVRAGEIVGVAGVASNSQTILAETMTGLRKPSSGRVLVDGNDVTDDPQRACRIGVAHIPDDRIVGIVPDLTVADNASCSVCGTRALPGSACATSAPNTSTPYASQSAPMCGRGGRIFRSRLSPGE